MSCEKIWASPLPAVSKRDTQALSEGEDLC
jgi:hypothetical protein